MALSLARIQFVATEWREVVSTDTAVQTEHPLAPELLVTTLLDDSTAAGTEAARVQTLRGTERSRYEFVAQLDDETMALDLGSIVEIKHNRFGLATGKNFIVISLEPDAADGTVRIGVWG